MQDISTSGSRLTQKTLISMTMDEDNNSHRRLCRGGLTPSLHRRRTRHHLLAGKAVAERQPVRDEGRHGQVWLAQTARRARSSEEPIGRIKGDDYATDWTLKRRWTVTTASEDLEIMPMQSPDYILPTLYFDGPASVASRSSKGNIFYKICPVPPPSEPC